jgi:aspartate aminotransferase
MARLGTETAFEVMVKAKALEAKGRDIVHLEIGEPDFGTPGNIVDAATDALHKGFTHYGPSAGLPQLREVIAQYVSETRRINVTPEEVVVVPGGKPIIFFSVLAFAETGDEVIYPNPGFPIYESMINYVGAKAVPIRLREELDFRLDVDELSDQRSDEVNHLEFTAESDGWRAWQKGHRRHRPRYRRSQHHGVERRDLQPTHFRR